MLERSQDIFKMAKTCVISHADGSFLCTDHVPEGADPSEFDPVRPDDTLNEKPNCIVCGQVFDYMIIDEADT